MPKFAKDEYKDDHRAPRHSNRVSKSNFVKQIPRDQQCDVDTRVGRKGGNTIQPKDGMDPGISFKQKLLHGVKKQSENYASVLMLEGRIDGWLERSIVGKLRSPDLLEGAQDSFVLAGMHSVRVRHLRGMLVLLIGDEGSYEFNERIKRWLEGNVLGNFPLEAISTLGYQASLD